MACHVTAAAVANSFSVPNTSHDDDGVVVLVSKVSNGSKLVPVSISALQYYRYLIIS